MLWSAKQNLNFKTLKLNLDVFNDNNFNGFQKSKKSKTVGQFSRCLVTDVYM